MCQWRQNTYTWEHLITFELLTFLQDSPRQARRVSKKSLTVKLSIYFGATPPISPFFFFSFFFASCPHFFSHNPFILHFCKSRRNNPPWCQRRRQNNTGKSFFAQQNIHIVSYLLLSPSFVVFLSSLFIFLSKKVFSCWLVGDDDGFPQRQWWWRLWKTEAGAERMDGSELEDGGWRFSCTKWVFVVGCSETHEFLLSHFCHVYFAGRADNDHFVDKIGTATTWDKYGSNKEV